jgi:hypothetical protein
VSTIASPTSIDASRSTTDNGTAVWSVTASPPR